MGQSTIKRERRAAKVQAPTARRVGLPRSRMVLVGVAGGVALLAAVVLVIAGASSGGDAPPPAALPHASAATAVFDGIPQSGTTIGARSAPVTLVVYADAQCPYCRVWDTETLPVLVRRFVRPGQLRIEFRGLAFVGPDSQRGLRALLAAGAQHRLFQAAELLYLYQGTENTGWLSDRFVTSLIASLPGVDRARLRAAMGSQAVTDQIARAAAQARRDGVIGTPSVLVGATGGDLARVDLQSAGPEGTVPAVESALAQTG
jgi:protein-disulfide isomerase